MILFMVFEMISLENEINKGNLILKIIYRIRKIERIGNEVEKI